MKLHGLRPVPHVGAAWLARVVVITLFALWSATHLDGFSWDYDEGIHVYIAWLVQQGHPLYTQTFSPYTPGFIAALVAAFNLFGATVFSARMVAVLFAALGVLGVMLATGELVKARSQSGRGNGAEGALAELTAAALLILTPSFFQWSRAAMSDLPSAALAALAIALTLIYMRDQRLRWLFASEFVFACAMWVKLISVGGAVAIVLAIWLVLRERRADIKRALIGSLLVGTLALLPLLLFDVRALYEQAIYFHAQKRAAYGQSLIENFSTLMEFLGNNLTLTALAALGVLLSLLNHATRQSPAPRDVTHGSLITLVWFVATFASLMWQTPLFANHHAVVLVFALAALAGAAVAWSLIELAAVLGRKANDDKRIGLPSFAVRLSLIAICLLFVLVGLGQYPDQLRAVAAPPFQPVAEEAVALLDALTPPTALIVSDAQMIVFRARRQSPPALADTSRARMDSGNLTAAQLITLTQQSNANTILFWSGRLTTLQPFVEWVERNYHPVRSAFQKPNSSYRLLMLEPHPQYALNARIGEGITFWGYDLNRREDFLVISDPTLSLTLYFQKTGPVERSYTVFTHLLGPDGRVVAQADRLPLAGRYPTDQWRADEFIADEFVIPLAADMRAGEYQIEVGMYLRESLQRLPLSVAGIRQADDRLLLKSVTLRPR